MPFFMVWGDRFKSQDRFKGLTSSLDIFATVKDALKIEDQELNRPIDGVSLLPYLSGKKTGNPHKVLFWRKMDTRAVREGDYKLIMTRGVDTVLYNVNREIDEMTNLRFKQPEVAKHLMELVNRWEADECMDPKWTEEAWRSTTNGYHRRLMKNEIKTADDLRKK